ncbi:MAG: hypothetical protein ABFD64_11710 [Armatimonadota bacterium]
MNKLISGHISIAALVLLCAAVPIKAQNDNDPERGSLRGLDGVMVLVEDLRPDIITDGVTVNMIQNTAEERLKKANIKVLSEAELRKTPGFPYLYININSIKPPGGSGYIYSISLDLYQAVVLDRDSDNKCLASTWETSLIGMAPTSQIKGLTSRITALVDEFVSDYKAVNKSEKAPYSAKSLYDADFDKGFDFQGYLGQTNWIYEADKGTGISSSLLIDKPEQPEANTSYQIHTAGMAGLG